MYLVFEATDKIFGIFYSAVDFCQLWITCEHLCKVCKIDLVPVVLNCVHKDDDRGFIIITVSCSCRRNSWPGFTVAGAMIEV